MMAMRTLLGCDCNLLATHLADFRFTLVRHRSNPKICWLDMYHLLPELDIEMFDPLEGCDANFRPL
jgi:hypothetical protein